jgi:hypothetical protein
MIYLAAPLFVINGLTIMRDDADPLQYYYYPNNPQLALNPDGTPTFLFIKFKNNQPVPPGVESGGGFLNFDVDLRVDSDTLDEATRQIRSQMSLDQNPRLVPLQYRNGTTRLIFLDAASPATTPAGAAPATTVTAGAATPPPATTTPAGVAGAATAPAPALQFVESASYSAAPSLYGDNRSAFSVSLTPQAATLVQACLSAPTFLAGVVYDLTFVGLRPAFHVTLKVDWHQVYNFLENQFHASASVPFVTIQSDIDAATEKLIEQRVIDLQVVSYAAGAADADITKQKDAATDWVQKMVTDAFFKPSIPPHGLSSDLGGGKAGAAVQTVKNATSPANVGYSLKSLNETDMKNLNVNITEQDATEVRIVPQGHLAGLMDILKTQPLDNYFREVDLNDPFFQRVRVDVNVANAFNTDHIDTIIVNMNYAGRNAQPIGLALNATTLAGSASWELDTAVGMTYSYTVTVAFKPDAFLGDTTEVTSPVQISNTPKIVIDPRQFYTLVAVDIEAAGIDWKNYSQVLVEVTSDEDTTGAKAQSFILTSAAAKAAWVYRPSSPDKAGYRYRKIYIQTAAPPVVVDWMSATGPEILVSDLHTDILNITVTTDLDFVKIPRILVTMQYRDEANNVSYNEVLQLNSTSNLLQWAKPIIDKTKRDYTYGATLMYADHTVKTFPPVPSSDILLDITDTFSRNMNVVVSASGDDFDTAGLDRVELNLVYTDGGAQPQSLKVALRSLSDTAIFTYQVHDPAHMGYSYSGMYYAKDGFNQPIPNTTSDKANLVIPIKAS